METDATPTGLRLLPKLTIASGNVGRIFPNSLRCETATTPLGLLRQTQIPRVDAKRVNPGLSCITASRLNPQTGLRKNILRCAPSLMLSNRSDQSRHDTSDQLSGVSLLGSESARRLQPSTPRPIARCV